MEEGTNSSRAEKWIKDIFKKKEEGELEQKDVSDEAPSANGHKTVELADINEEEEEENHETKAKANGIIPNQHEDTKEMENHENSGESEKNESEGSDTKEMENHENSGESEKNESEEDE